MQSIILATSNAGKLKELSALLYPIQCIPQTAFHIQPIPEDRLSFVENALLKARHASALTNQAALADDSGLVVPALEGAPGIYSARYAGPNACDEDNIKKLLTDLQEIPTADKHAYFYCALVIVQYPEDPSPLLAWGRLDGQIHDCAQGNQGFGYDPIFYLPHHQCTMAQLDPALKNKISHRAQAYVQLQQQLQAL